MRFLTFDDHRRIRKKRKTKDERIREKRESLHCISGANQIGKSCGKSGKRGKRFEPQIFIGFYFRFIVFLLLFQQNFERRRNRRSFCLYNFLPTPTNFSHSPSPLHSLPFSLYLHHFYRERERKKL